MTYRIKNEHGEDFNYEFREKEQAFAYMTGYSGALGGADSTEFEQIMKWSLWQRVGDEDKLFLQPGDFHVQAEEWAIGMQQGT